eukprot:gnl/TRDRNA2_/TRDRNA2_42776_c0_seq1.p1 gnl/TRDRNA2_/TRDRNA2_42776_c0~~gnl/TRDRNA2_/TRDRNA2_42776_c0_seq1.p1  ORF type:complete len:312 (+),score=44.80 gnl/TRDRNA2_/TRDRNA2_42776_c0_seq1:32-937(+)
MRALQIRSRVGCHGVRLHNHLAAVAGAVPSWVPHKHAVVGVLTSPRAFSTTDGPFRHMRPKFVDRKKHYGQVLVMADRRKLLETAQDVLNEPAKKLPLSFWEVFSRRCIQSMHLFEPLELAIVARAFDVHNIKIRRLDIFGAAAGHARNFRSFPGVAVVVLMDIFSRRLASSGPELEFLGRKSADSMWELSPRNAIFVLSTVTEAGVQDTALCSRVAAKANGQMELLVLEDLVRVTAALAGQGHRDLELLNRIADRTTTLCGETASSAAAEAAKQIASGFEKLEVDVPEPLMRAAATASGE